MITEHKCCKCGCKCACHQEKRWCQCHGGSKFVRLTTPRWCMQCDQEIREPAPPAPDPGVLVRVGDPVGRLFNGHADGVSRIVRGCTKEGWIIYEMPEVQDIGHTPVSELTFNGRPVRGFDPGWTDEDIARVWADGTACISTYKSTGQMAHNATLAFRAERDRAAGRETT